MTCVIIAGTVANLCGCQLDEGSIHPCVVGGADIGGILYALGMTGWFGIASFATGVPALGLFALIATAEWLFSLYRRKAATRYATEATREGGGN